jgi:hypothetical protein
VVAALAGEKMLNNPMGGGGGRSVFMRAHACKYAQQKLGASAASSVSHLFAFVPRFWYMLDIIYIFFRERGGIFEKKLKTAIFS